MVVSHALAPPLSSANPSHCWLWRSRRNVTIANRPLCRVSDTRPSTVVESAAVSSLFVHGSRDTVGDRRDKFRRENCSDGNHLRFRISNRRRDKACVTRCFEERHFANRVKAVVESSTREKTLGGVVSSCSQFLSLPKALEGLAMGTIKSCVIFTVMLSIALGAVAEVDEAIISIPYERRGMRPDIPLFTLDQLEKMDAKAPEQVHVALGGPHTMRVSWVTKDEQVPSKVEFGTVSGKYDRVAEGEHLAYSFLNYKSPMIHHVVLGSDIPLKENTEYFYRCGGHDHEFSFTTPPPVGPEVPIKFSVIGDLGQTGWSVSTLEHMVQDDAHMVLHAGDLSYADFFQPRWDSWGRLIEPLASSIPWMVTEGNHEIESVWPFEPHFKAYNARWPMPFEESGSPSNLFYSFETASCHILMLGSYADFEPGSPQYRWLEEDLAKVDRKRTPWLITVLHAPWYNSNEAHQNEAAAVNMMDSLEPLLMRAGVDMVFAGHVHAYERSTRVNKGVSDPCGMVHITIGDGGNREGLASRYLDDVPEWSVMREASFGHGTLEITNSTHALWKWHRNQDDVAVVADETWLLSHSADGESCPLPEAAIEQKPPSLRMQMLSANS